MPRVGKSAITSFSSEYAFLSNFWPCEIRYESIAYPSVEHAYQAAKSEVREIRLNIASCSTARAAKKCGRSITLRHDWDAVKVKVMEDLLTLKFADEYLRSRLLGSDGHGSRARLYLSALQKASHGLRVTKAPSDARIAFDLVESTGLRRG